MVEPVVEPDETERRVRAALHVDARTAPFADRLEICHGEGGLELHGTVEDLTMCRRALSVASTAAGNVPVANQLMLEPYPQRQDGQITVHARSAFDADSALQGQPITVTVQDGRVRLEGTTDSQITKRLAEATCWWIPGVRAVDNQLVVDNPEQDRDWIVLEAIHVIFSKDWLLSGSNIMFSSRNGVVKLTGVVSGPELVRAAENDVWAIDGVAEVINELQVMPEYPLEAPSRQAA